VTGLVVNEQSNLPRTTRRWLRAVQHRLETGRPASLTPGQLAGWLSFWRMVPSLSGLCSRRKHIFLRKFSADAASGRCTKNRGEPSSEAAGAARRDGIGRREAFGLVSVPASEPQRRPMLSRRRTGSFTFLLHQLFPHRRTPGGGRQRFFVSRRRLRRAGACGGAAMAVAVAHDQFLAAGASIMVMSYEEWMRDTKRGLFTPEAANRAIDTALQEYDTGGKTRRKLIDLKTALDPGSEEGRRMEGQHAEQDRTLETLVNQVSALLGPGGGIVVPARPALRPPPPVRAAGTSLTTAGLVTQYCQAVKAQGMFRDHIECHTRATRMHAAVAGALSDHDGSGAPGLNLVADLAGMQASSTLGPGA